MVTPCKWHPRKLHPGRSEPEEALVALSAWSWHGRLGRPDERAASEGTARSSCFPSATWCVLHHDVACLELSEDRNSCGEAG